MLDKYDQWGLCLCYYFVITTNVYGLHGVSPGLQLMGTNRLSRGENLALGGVWRGHRRGLLVGYEEVLANRPLPQTQRVWGNGCSGQVPPKNTRFQLDEGVTGAREIGVSLMRPLPLWPNSRTRSQRRRNCNQAFASKNKCISFLTYQSVFEVMQSWHWPN